MPFILDEGHKLYYCRGLKEYGSEKGCLVETCRSAQDKYMEMVAYFMKEE